jgi:hypothetical protein
MMAIGSGSVVVVGIEIFMRTTASPKSPTTSMMIFLRNSSKGNPYQMVQIETPHHVAASSRHILDLSRDTAVCVIISMLGIF